MRRIGYLMTILVLVVLVAGSSGLAQDQREGYFPPEVLDKPLGIERLPNGNTLITDGGGAYYTATDAAIMEVSPAGEIAWLYAVFVPSPPTFRVNLGTSGVTAQIRPFCFWQLITYSVARSRRAPYGPASGKCPWAIKAMMHRLVTPGCPRSRVRNEPSSCC